MPPVVGRAARRSTDVTPFERPGAAPPANCDQRFVGLTYDKGTNAWRVRVTLKSHQHHVGRCARAAVCASAPVPGWPRRACPAAQLRGRALSARRGIGAATHGVTRGRASRPPLLPRTARFKDEAEAAQAYDVAALLLLGDAGAVNFGEPV
jgi:hypothetical protein